MTLALADNTPSNSTAVGQMMKACVLCDVKRLEVRDVPRPFTSSHEVLVRIAAVGLCGTDAHIFAGEANYNTNAHGSLIPLALQPQILGHEITGVVEETGSQVDDLRAGDRVVIDQGLNCFSRRHEVLCDYCKTGDSHQCEFYREHGITGLPGGLADFIAVPAVNAIKINTEIKFTDAALVEPLGCVVHSSNTVIQSKSRYVLNSDSPERRVRSVLICGAGPSGLLFTQYLRNVLGYDGALIVTDPNRHKRDLAVALGATKSIDSTRDDLVEIVREHTGGKGVEYMIEASGSGDVFASIPGLISKQATVLLYGHGHAGHDLSILNNILFREPFLVCSVGASGGFGVDGRSEVYAHALKIIEQKRVDVRPLITHEYNSLDQVETALSHDMHSDGYIKGVMVLGSHS
jgi:threonine dehydrogenase-like Zn-dependent dehydrogenase